MDKNLFDHTQTLRASLREVSAADHEQVRLLALQLGAEWPTLDADCGESAFDVAKTLLTVLQTVGTTIDALLELWADAGCSAASDRSIGLALTYLARADDKVADHTPGSLGWLDDYVVLQVVLSDLMAGEATREWAADVLCPDPTSRPGFGDELHEWAACGLLRIQRVLQHLPPARREAMQGLYLQALLAHDTVPQQTFATRPALPATPHAHRAAAPQARRASAHPEPPAALPASTAAGAPPAGRSSALTEAEKQARETRAWKLWASKPTGYQSPYIFGALPRGGFVAARR